MKKIFTARDFQHMKNLSFPNLLRDMKLLGFKRIPEAENGKGGVIFKQRDHDDQSTNSVYVVVHRLRGRRKDITGRYARYKSWAFDVVPIVNCQ